MRVRAVICPVQERCLRSWKVAFRFFVFQDSDVRSPQAGVVSMKTTFKTERGSRRPSPKRTLEFRRTCVCLLLTTLSSARRSSDPGPANFKRQFVHTRKSPCPRAVHGSALGGRTPFQLRSQLYASISSPYAARLGQTAVRYTARCEVGSGRIARQRRMVET